MALQLSKFALVAGASILVTSCGTADPSTAEGRAAFEQEVTKELRGSRFTVSGFEKTNGQPAEINGVPNYTLFYSAKVDYPEGYRTECLQEFRGIEGFQVGMRCATDFNFSKTPFRPAQAGASVEVKGTIQFSKTENGWLAGQTTIQPLTENSGN